MKNLLILTGTAAYAVWTTFVPWCWYEIPVALLLIFMILWFNRLSIGAMYREKRMTDKMENSRETCRKPFLLKSTKQIFLFSMCSGIGSARTIKWYPSGQRSKKSNHFWILCPTPVPAISIFFIWIFPLIFPID